MTVCMPPRNLTWRNIGPSVHQYIVPPPPPIPVFAAIEVPHVVQHVHPGKITSPSIQFDGEKVVRDGHDTGLLIPHSGPLNAGLALAVATSKYKFNFGAAKVKVEGDAVAIFHEVAPPVFCAFPYSLPALGVNSLLLLSTVTVGATMADLVAGWASITLDVAADLAFGYGKGLKDLSLPVSDLLKGLAVDSVKAVARAITTEGNWGSVRTDLSSVGVGFQITQDANSKWPGAIEIGDPGNPSSIAKIPLPNPSKALESVKAHVPFMKGAPHVG